jgi:acyl-CoA reductase-like NAD-dependent aldehyde dehydrogenase
MPHWKEQGVWSCVEGTAGSRPPVELEPLPTEKIFRKQFYSAFEGEELSLYLKGLAVDHLTIAGLYLHSCVRSTVLDAYARGYTVWIASEATASIDPLHGKVTRNFLAKRAACFLSSAEVLRRSVIREVASFQPGAEVLPAGVYGGKWIAPGRHVVWEHRDPTDWERVLARVALADPEDIAEAVVSARQAQNKWAGFPVSCRVQILESWAKHLTLQENELAVSMAKELGKPVALARDEVRFAVRLLQATVSQHKDQDDRKYPAGEVYARHSARGIVGLVTPWNNPVAIPAGKIGPATVHGNAVIWKPALQAPRTTLLLSQTISRAGFPDGLVNLLFGGPATVRNLVSRDEIPFISFTGSSAAGREVAALCGCHGKTLQAELGGNNAAIVFPDADIQSAARELAFSAFAFAGQRCTATRRFIVHAERAQEFQNALVAAIESLRIGQPLEEQTDVGPVISREKQESLKAIVRAGLAGGARLVCGGKIPAGWAAGCWFEPTLLEVSNPSLPVVQEEAFGPIAVWQTVSNLDEALLRLNGVQQGLTASFYSQDPKAWSLFLEQAECGVLKLNQPTMGVDSSAPFGGWKASGIGPPEHGPGDLESYTRWQAVYAHRWKQG